VVRFDGLDHEIEFVGSVDLSRDAVVLAWRHGLGFAEVVQPVNPSGRVISHREYNTRTAFRAREQEQMIGAEVEHRGKENQRAGAERLPLPLAAPLRGYPVDSSRHGISPQRGA
jgi:hypothetical protein